MNALILALAVLLVILAVGLGLFGCFLLFLLGRACWYAQEAYFRGMTDEAAPVKKKRQGLLSAIREWIGRLRLGKREVPA